MLRIGICDDLADARLVLRGQLEQVLSRALAALSRQRDRAYICRSGGKSACRSAALLALTRAELGEE